MTPASAEHAHRCVKNLSLSVGPRRKMSPEELAEKVGVYASTLAGMDVSAVTRACQLWATGSVGDGRFPDLPDLLATVREDQETQARREAEVRSAQDGGAAAGAEDLAHSANAAFGLLSNAHLRELDRLLPPQRQAIVEAAGRMFLPHWRKAIEAEGQYAMRPYIAMASEFVEGRLGRTWRQILDEEAAGRPPVSAPRGFKSAGTYAPEAGAR